MTGAPEHREQLAHRLAWHQRSEEHDRFGDPLEIGMKI